MSPVALRLSALYVALYAGFGVHLPFFGLWLAERGLSYAEIGVVIGAPLLGRAFAAAPLSALADRFGDPARAVALYAAFVAVLMTSLPWLEGFWAFLLVTLVAGMVWGTLVPLIDAWTVTAARTGAGVDYGRTRLWGSVSFIVVASIAGVVIDRLGLWIVPPALVASATALVVLAITASSRPKARRAPPALADGIRRLAADRLLLLALLAGACGQASHALFYTIGGVHWRSLGYGEAVIGALWAIGVIAEIALFAVSTRLLKSVSALSLLVIGLSLGALRWTVMAFDPPLGLLVVWQLLHAASFACVHAATVQIIASRYPPEMAASGQGAYFAILGIANGAVMAASGPLYGALGGLGYVTMGALAAFGVALALAARRQPQSSGSEG